MFSFTRTPAPFLGAVLLILFAGYNTLAVPGGCSSVDFRVARTFDATVNLGFPAAAYAVADLDGDSKPDLVVTDSSANSVAVLLNDGTGRPGAAKKYGVGAQPSAVVIVDVNGDGMLDLAVANSQSNNVAILLGTGGGTFGGLGFFAAGSGPRAIAAGDFNGDGKPDLAVVNSGTNGASSMSVLLGNGTGLFSAAPGSPVPIADQAVSVVVADFNSDGKRDLAVATYSGNFVLSGDGAGGFASPVKIYDGAAASLATADLNGDGKADLALGSYALVILLGDGAGGFSAPLVFPDESRNSVSSVVIGDIDGDGKQDIASYSSYPSGITLFQGDGTGAFVITRSYLPASSFSNLALGDFDMDGDPDLVAGNSILINTGSGIFDAPRAVYTVNDVTVPGSGTSATPYDIALGDFNADGRSDMAVLHRATTGPDLVAARVAILMRDATGNFTQSSSIVFSSGSSLYSIVSGDFNRDGRADLAIAGTVSSPFSHMVSIRLSNGDGTFATSQTVNFGEEPWDIAKGNFNGDSDPDLVIVGIHGTTTALLGNGAGGFSIRFGPNTGAHFSRVAVGDLNGDSKTDLSITDFLGQRVVTALGDGTGSFSTFGSLSVPGSASDIVVDDFNSDGKRDLAVTAHSLINSSINEGSLSVFLGDGAGGFASPVTYPTGAQPEAIVSSDLDGDGITDLAIANRGSSSFSVLSGDGTGAFHAPVSFGVWGGPSALVVDDFDSDGRADIALALYSAQAVGLVYGKPPSAEPCLFVDDVTTTEGDSGTSTVDVPVHLSQASAHVAKVNYVLKGASATEGQDFIGDSGTLTFQPGETYKTVTVTILSDTLDEDDESLMLNLSGEVGARISDGSAKVTINDNDPAPALSISDVSVAEGNSPFSPSNATFVVSLSAPSAKTVQVDFASTAGTASSGQDFNPTTGHLFFGAGVTTQMVTVSVPGDTTYEPDETFIINLTNPSNASIADGQGQGTILNDDPVPAISISDASTTEGVGADKLMNVVVGISNASSAPISVDFSTSDDTATSGSDFVASTSTLTFNPGETQKNLSITIKDDSLDEVNETFLINLSNPVNATIVDGQARCTIFDNDGPSVSINDVSITEGQAGSTNATFTLTLSAASVQDISLRLDTSGGTATASVDYQRVTSRFLNIPAGSTSITTNISVIADLAIESDETFFVNLSAPVNCTIADGQGLGTILNDDTTSVQFSTDSVTVNEAAGSVQVTVLHVGQVSEPITISYSTFDGSASQRSDYTAAFGTLVFAAGEASKTITLFITNDVLVENSESFFIALNGPSGARPNPPSVLTININSDDAGGAPNPVDNADFFVRQHYIDFLNREPDGPGLAYWSNQITECQQPGATCDAGVRRINVSAAFFLSIEFQETGYLVERIYKTAYGDADALSALDTYPTQHSIKAPIIRLNEFLADSQQISKDVQVGVGNWQAQIEANKVAFTQDFVARSRFITAYPMTMTPAEFVDKLFLNAAVTPSASERSSIINEFGGTGNTADTVARARALRRVAENTVLAQQESNKAFVLMQYFGYLRRNPNDPQDTDHTGYDFWLHKLDQFNGNFESAQMVQAFIDSIEYRTRFAP